MLFVKNLLILMLLLVRFVFSSPEEEQGVIYANKCEGNLKIFFVINLKIFFEIN